MRASWTKTIAALALVTCGSARIWAAVPYMPVPVPGPPILGPGLTPPSVVYGKEYSHDLDFSTVGPVLDPEQVILWDGLGGTTDGIDFSGTRPNWQPDQEVDAIANHRDALFHETTFFDKAHLVFSHDDEVTVYPGGAGPVMFAVPAAGPVLLSNGNVIGGAGELSVERAGGFGFVNVQETWAKQPDINAMPLPTDVDGLELWGPEATATGLPTGDTDKYSLEMDAPSGVSVWNGSGTPYVPKPMVDAAVMGLLGALPGTAFEPYSGQQGRPAINLDALMVYDIVDDPDTFNTNGGGGTTDSLIDQNGTTVNPVQQLGDMILFSIKQIVDPMDADGYYATGSELIWLSSTGVFGFLSHGGHVWDHTYTLSDLRFDVPGGNNFYGIIDINAIDAIGEGVFTPPPVLPGDFNGDLVVDAADYTIYRDNEGLTEAAFALGTGTGDGVVDVLDYDLWKTNFGGTLGPAALSFAAGRIGSVPEPSTFMGLALAIISAAAAFRRR